MLDHPFRILHVSLDQNLAAFLVGGFAWQKKANAAPMRALEDDCDTVAEASRRTSA